MSAHAGGGEPARPPWRLLAARLRPHARTWAAATALSLLGAAAALAQPLAARDVIEALGEDRSIREPLVVLSGLVIVGAVLTSVALYIVGRLAETVVLRTRLGLGARMLRLRVAEIDRLAPGDLVSRMTSDTTLLREAASSALVEAITGSVVLVGAIALMAYVDPVLLAITAAVMLVLVVAVAFALPRISRALRRAQESVGELGGALERALGAIRTVKASGAEEREEAGLGEAARAAWRRGVEAAAAGAVVGVSAGLAVQVAFLAVLGVGGARVANGEMTAADLVAFLLLLFYLAEPLASLTVAATQLQGGLAAVARLAEVERLATEEDAARGAGAPARAPASVELTDVWFRYAADAPPVLASVSLIVPGGGLTALVGPSGAGKTTVFSLLERFVEVDAGRVAIDGRDVRDWPLADLRAAIGYVEQDAPLLAGTLRENLVYAAPGAGDDELAAVLAATRLEAFVARLPDGLETRVGTRGAGVSGGERQRIAIARALLRRPRLLLLDEATSQLDAANELALREAVAEVARGTTVIAVAHRLSTVVAADRIVVLEDGRVRAVGRHPELLRDDALYGALAATQLVARAGGDVPAGA